MVDPSCAITLREPIVILNIIVIIMGIRENQMRKSVRFWSPQQRVCQVTGPNANIIFYKRGEVKSCQLAELQN